MQSDNFCLSQPLSPVLYGSRSILHVYMRHEYKIDLRKFGAKLSYAFCRVCDIFVFYPPHLEKLAVYEPKCIDKKLLRFH